MIGTVHDLTGLTAGLATPARVIECTCPTEHTITKLGHSRACHWFGEPARVEIAIRGCGGEHVDGTPHDFEWATYSDDTTTTGVCRCGTSALTHAPWTAP